MSFVARRTSDGDDGGIQVGVESAGCRGGGEGDQHKGVAGSHRGLWQVMHTSVTDGLTQKRGTLPGWK